MNTYAVEIGRMRKLAVYAQLGKIRVYHHLYEWLLVVLLLDMASNRADGWVLASGLLLLLIVSAQAAACAADDLTGFRDGSDAENYRKGSQGDGPKMLPKPLVAGLLSEREVIVFAVGSTIVGTAALIGAFAALDWNLPVGVAIAALLVLALTIQYSTGLKFSYWPGGAEFHIFVVNAALLVLPFWAIAGHLNTEAVLLGALAGVWFVLVVGWGNVRDRAGDEAVDRQTTAVMAPRAYPVFLVALYVVSVVLAVLPFALGLFDAVGLLCVTPLIALATAQMYFGAIRRDAGMAMWLGFRCIDAGGLGFAAAILLS